MLNPVPDIVSRTSSTDPTRQALAEMLTENTGASILDSGGAYGRHWQTNRQVTDFEAAKTASARFALPFSHELGDAPTCGWSFECTLNVYPWLAERLTYLPALDAMFERFVDWRDNQHPPLGWLGYANLWTSPEEPLAFLEEDAESNVFSESVSSMFAALREDRVTGLYGDGNPFVVNTYNAPDLLSQTLQYVYLEVAGRQMVLLSVHGGCDVRGGYGRPRFFELNSECAIFDNARAFLGSFDGPTWYTDDAGATWHADARGVDPLLEYQASDDVALRGEDVLVISEDGVGFCPVTGEPLRLSW